MAKWRHGKQARDPHLPPDEGPTTYMPDPGHMTAKFGRGGGEVEEDGATGDRYEGKTSSIVIADTPKGECEMQRGFFSVDFPHHVGDYGFFKHL